MCELDLRELFPVVVRLFGPAASGVGYRLAPDEQLVIGDDATALLEEGAPTAVNVSSGFTCLEISGEGWENAFAYLSEIELPAERPALVQGHIADTPAKAIVGTDLLCLFPTTFGHHARRRILDLAGVGFTVREVSLERASA